MLRYVRGQAMVEMALVLPFLLLVTLGVMELGFYVYTYSELENATRRASERASKTPPVDPANLNDQCAQLIREEALNGVTLSDLQSDDITITIVGGATPSIGNQVEVAINYTGQFLTPIGRQFLSDVLNFSFTSRRTIVSIDPPPGYTYGCTPQT